MRIIIKELIDDENYYKNLNILGKKLYDFKLQFVKQRLDVLKDEMLKEENDNPSAGIKLIMEGETVNDFTLVKGYSDNLKRKIKDCFFEQGKYFEDRLLELRKSTFN